MDYEKKYKEALERARIWKEKSGMPKNRQGILDDIFPELKESEDERMRKALKEYFINSFQNNGVAAICGVHIKDILAWLEKQVEQKPAWSEEDEKKRNLLIAILNVNHPNGYFKANPANTLNMEVMHTEELVSWLKSLRPQNRWISVDKEVYVKEPVLAQKKDKSDSFGGFVVCCDHTLSPNVYERYIKLDNNCFQNVWKPSKEQMNVLNEVINFAADHGTMRWNDYIYNVLKSLREQLKEL